MKIKYAISMLETATNENYDEARIYGGCLLDIDKNKSIYFDNLDDLFKFISKKHCIVYVYDLKYYGTFIVSYLMSKKYKQLVMTDYLNKKYTKKSYNILSDDNGNFYNIDVLNDFKTKYDKKQSKNVKDWIRNTFIDIKKILPITLAELGSIVGFDNPIKLDNNNYKQDNYTMNELEKQYVFNNCNIIAKNIQHLKEEGLKKFTISANAFNKYKEMEFNGNDLNYRRTLPELSYEVDKFIRDAYRGGWTYLNPKYHNRVNDRVSGITYDKNSMYPYIMYNKLLPYGEPIEFYGEYEYDKKYPLYIQELEIEFIDLKPNKLPFINIKDDIVGTMRYIESEYLEYAENITITLTNIEIELLKEMYFVGEITYKKGFKFKGTDTLFKKYIDYYYNKKQYAKNKAERQIAKLMLNSLYGKFCSKVDRYNINYIENDEGLIEKVKDKDSRYTINGYYSPLGCFITAYGRELIVQTAVNNIDTFIYSDTDSIHLDIKEEDMYNVNFDVDIDRTGALGLFKVEMIFTDSLFLGPKRYIEYGSEFGSDKPEEWHLTCVGLPKETKISKKEDFKYGEEFDITTSKRVKNGYLKVKQKYTIL